MNSRVSWSVDGIDPSVRERAEAAARRAGMSLNDWLNSTIGEAVPPNFRNPVPPRSDVDDIHQRLDAITRQIEHISRPAQRTDAPREQGVARQLNDAISRLDARLSQISNPNADRQAQERQQEKQQRQAQAVERAAGQVYPNQAYPNQAYPGQAHPPHAYPQQSYAPPQGYSSQGYPSQHYPSQGQAAQNQASRGHTSSQGYRPSPPLSPASLDFAVAEIAARQSELDNAPPPRQAMPFQPPPVQAPPIAPAAPPGPDFSSLERHLLKITSQIEALQRPDHLEQSIQAFRSELSDIRSAIMEAMPRRAIESIENEIRSLSRRIDDNRQSGVEPQALAGVERALSEIRQVLRSLMSAEQLAGYDEAIRALGGKLDMILRANDDPGAMQQLENAITALRAIVSNVASNDALARLSEDLHLLSSKVDQLARAAQNGDSFAGLEQRISDLTSMLAKREQQVIPDNSERIESALRFLSDRIDRLQVGNDSASAIAHLEQRVSYLLERLDSAPDQRSDNLGRVEEALQDVLRHLERQHASIIQLADSSRAELPPQDFARQDGELIDLVKRELSDIRFSQGETQRHTQDSLEAVHSTLGHVVDRLAMIEGDLRAVRSAPPPAPMPVEPPPAAAPMPMPAASSFEEAPRSMAAYAFEDAPRSMAAHAFDDAPQSMAAHGFEDEPRIAVAPQPKPELPNPAASQAARPHFDAAPREFHAVEPAAAAPTVPSPPLAISEILLPHAGPARPVLAPDLPPDHPLEPGTRPNGRMSSPSERIAASESAISEIPAAAPKEPVSSSSFIAAARRAAQAAAAQPLAEARAAAEKKGKKNKSTDGKKDKSSITSKIRSVLVAASVVVIVLGTFKMAMTLLENGAAPPTPPAAPASESSNEPAAQTPAAAKPAIPDQAPPSMTSPTPIGRQSFNTAPNPTDSVASLEIPQAAPSTDITGTIPTTQPANRRLASVAIPSTETLPDAIGGPNLRTAALKGDPNAAYEVAMRFAEGKGVVSSLEDAAKWYDRAAQAGVIPAVFRLGTFYEKGLGVKKDADIARRYYVQAAERGNAKAMHNLAVLDADGGGKAANYKSAAQWFRKAADRGVADSEFNLGILYARGIGVEQNLAESYKWFTLAAAQGDADAGRKRDDIAKRLDAQSLAAAKLAIQTFVAEPQPDDAVTVATPPGGWDGTAAPAQATAKPAAKPAAKRPATAHL
jgi:localization factor PodJL